MAGSTNLFIFWAFDFGYSSRVFDLLLSLSALTDNDLLNLVFLVPAENLIIRLCQQTCRHRPGSILIRVFISFLRGGDANIQECKHQAIDIK